VVETYGLDESTVDSVELEDETESEEA